jgi:hypothetical protein
VFKLRRRYMHKMYHQLAEIHAITAAQLAECARWLRSDSSLSPIRAGTSQPKHVVMPSMIILAPSPILISHPRPRHGGRIRAVSPRLTRVARARYPSIVRRAHGKANIATSSRTRSRSHATSPPGAPLAMRWSFCVLPWEARK